MKDGEQEGLFPTAEKIKKLTAKIELNHKRAKDALGKVADYGKFFKLFADYSGALDGAQADKADELLLENIRFGAQQCSELETALKSVDKLLVDAKDYAKEIVRLGAENSI